MNWWHRLAFILATCLVVTTGVRADSGGYASLRYAKTKARPFDVECDDTWVSCDGYRPVRLRIKPVGTTTFSVDRQITFEIKKPVLHNGLFGDFTERTVDLPQGAEQVDVLLMHQQTRMHTYASLRVWEGRRTLKNVVELSIAQKNSNSSNMDEAVPNVLIVDNDLPRLEDRQSGLGRLRGKNESEIPNPAGFVKGVPAYAAMRNQIHDLFGESWVDTAEAISAVSFLHPGDLPDQWLAYSGLDIIYLSLSEIQSIQEEHPGQWQAIERWCRSGGTLWLAGVGEELANIEQVDSLFGFAPSNENSFAAKWITPGKSEFGVKVDELDAENQSWINGKYVSKGTLGKAPKYADEKIGMSYRDLQFGRVVVFESDEPLATTDAWQWQWIFKSLDIDRWCWSKRHGFSPSRYNDGFWEHLIPDVGLAPVNSFRVIITLFALVVGPMNYMWLSRRRRLNWMLFTVPAAALLVTVALVSYALFTDGVAAKSRIRSVMEIDQPSGHASIWARQTYYAGVAPAGGIKFDEQTAVYPVDHNAAERTYNGGQERTTEWDQAQLLQSGFLPSRTTSQFLTVQSQASKLQLQVNRDTANQLATAKNLLGSEALLLVVRDNDSAFYVAEAVASGEDCALTPATVPEVSDKMGPLLELADRSLPDGVDLSLLSRSQNRWRWNNGNLSDPTSDTSRLEKTIDEIFHQWQTLPPGSYIAVMKDNVDLDCAIRAKDRKHELHLIRGGF